jgi:hypothetical protein
MRAEIMRWRGGSWGRARESVSNAANPLDSPDRASAAGLAFCRFFANVRVNRLVDAARLRSY